MSSVSSNTTARIASILNEIYGRDSAERILERYTRLISAHHNGSGSRSDHLDRSDSWLIAYPDHISGDGNTPLCALDRFITEHLEHGINGVHVLPCFPSSSDDGFSVMDYTSIDPRFGTWEDVEHLARSRNVMLDAVINHASTQGKWFEAWRSGSPGHAGFFRTEDPETDLSSVVRARQHPLLTKFTTVDGDRWVWTTFSSDQADLDYRNPEVMLAVADVLLTYASHGVSAIRLDAVGFLWKEPGTPSVHLPETHHIVRLIRATLDATYPHVLLISETNVPHRENISYLGDGTVPEADMVYQFPLPPLTLHAFGTGNAHVLKDWLTTINGIPPSTTYFNFLASHDGVGLRPLEGLVDGEDLEAIVALCTANGGFVTYRSDAHGAPVPYELNATWFDLIRGAETGSLAVDRHIASYALMFALRGEPAIYLQALIAEPNATNLARTSNEPRLVNRKRFTIDEIEARLQDPTSRASQSLDALLAMLAWRGATDAFHPSSSQRVLQTTDDVVGIERSSPSGTTARVYVNVSPTVTEIHDGHPGRLQGFHATRSRSTITLGPYGVAWLNE